MAHELIAVVSMSEGPNACKPGRRRVWQWARGTRTRFVAGSGEVYAYMCRNVRRIGGSSSEGQLERPDHDSEGG